MKKFLLSMVMVLNIIFLNTMSVYATTNIAELNGVSYASLSEAIEQATDGETIVLLGDVVENIKLDKDIVIDGQDQFTLTTQGSSSISNGTLKHLVLKPQDAASKLYFGNNAAQTKILLQQVTIDYDVATREYYTYSVAGNKANIEFNQTNFVNHPNNQGIVENAPEWSYGIYINDQSNEGSIDFTNSVFDGAFRTMISSASGKMTVEGCRFINSVYSVQGGPTSGAEAEATCLTTSSKADNQLSIINNTYDNAGAIYVQTPLLFEGNTVMADQFMHYIQAKASIGETIDFSNNTYLTGENHFVIVDSLNTKVLMPEGMPLIDYMVWSKTSIAQRPASYEDYLYYYNADGSITYIPQSDMALEQFLNQNNGNKQVTNQDVVFIQKDLNLNHLNVAEDRVVNLQIAEGATLGVTGTVDLLGTLNIEGTGTFKINDHAKLNIGVSGKLNIAQTIKVENNGSIQNDGLLLIPDSISGTGKIEGNGLINHYPTIMAEDQVLILGDTFDPLKGVTAKDQEDGEIKDIEVVHNTVNPHKVGTYEVTYKATDSQGASTIKTIKVVVNEKTMVTPDTNSQSTDTSNRAPSTGILLESNIFVPILIAMGVLLSVLLVWKKKSL